MKHLVIFLTLIGAVVLTFSAMLAWFIPTWWVAELIGHLRVQVGVGLLICAVVLIWRFRWRAVPLLIPALANLSVVIWLLMPPATGTPPESEALQILHYNLDMTASDHERAFAYLREHPSDILFVQELTSTLADQLQAALPAYKMVYQRPLENTHGSALLLPRTSQLEVRAVGEVFLPASSPRPMITATLVFDGQAFTLLSMQVIRPKDAYTEEIQEQEYAAIGTWIRQQREQTGLPMIVIGDFNSTQWSDRFRRLLVASGLRDSSQGFGYQPTWPALLPGLLAIPIDHCLVSPEVAVVARTPGPDLGGDHTPLLVRFALKR